jgi:hypothetical protein
MEDKEIDLSVFPYEDWVRAVFERSGEERENAAWFMPEAPQQLVEHFKKLCLEFNKLEGIYSHEQIDSGVWFLLGGAGIEVHQYLVCIKSGRSIPMELRLECIHSMYHVFADYVANCTVDVMGNGFFMWWDLICSYFWVCAEMQRSKEKVQVQYAELDEDERAILDEIFFTLKKILAIDECRTQTAALHGLGHCQHPEARQVVQDYIDRYGSESTEKGLRWLESCRDGTVQ